MVRVWHSHGCGKQAACVVAAVRQLGSWNYGVHHTRLSGGSGVQSNKVESHFVGYQWLDGVNPTLVAEHWLLRHYGVLNGTNLCLERRDDQTGFRFLSGHYSRCSGATACEPWRHHKRHPVQTRLGQPSFLGI